MHSELVRITSLPCRIVDKISIHKIVEAENSETHCTFFLDQLHELYLQLLDQAGMAGPEKA